MSLTAVKMSEEIWLTCLSHALSTETEEVMGLLLGDIETSNKGEVTALIWGASPQTRSDRRKDRVETNAEQLAAASSQAERMTQVTGRTTRVIGWYHSHPHITVLPSHVDLRTQATYQLLDSGFIGLIFSCFSEDAQKVGRIQVIAFQSLDGKQRNLSGQFGNRSNVDHESPSSRNLLSAREGAFEACDRDTGDSRASKGQGKGSELEQFFTHADANSFSKDKRGGYSTNLAPSPISDEDSMELSAGMQEAMYWSNLDMSDAEFVRKEIPLQVVPSQSIIKLENPLSAFTQMQHVLFEEERAAYKQAILQNARDGRAHPLDVIHHSSTYTASMCKLIEYCLSPALNVLQNQLQENEIRSAMLAEEAKLLEAELSARGSDSHAVSALQKCAKTELQGVGMKVSHHQQVDSSAGKTVKDIKVYRSRSKGSRGGGESV